MKSIMKRGMAALPGWLRTDAVQGDERMSTRERPDRGDGSSGQERVLHAPGALSPSVLRCSIAYNRYGGYCVPTSSAHRPAARAVLDGDVYEPKTIEYMIAHCGDGDIVHAGTYFGDFLPALSSAVADDAMVWAFEPNEENFRCAGITAAINDVTNVRLVHAGLGAASQTLFVRTVDDEGTVLGGSSRITDLATGAHPVDIVSIDEAVPRDRDVTIVQLDVERYELEALSGALATISRCLPIIIIERLPESQLHDSEWFADNILSLGYRQVSTLHHNTVYAVE